MTGIRQNDQVERGKQTTVDRKSERELVVTRSFNAPAHIVFDAWTKPDLFRQWWTPQSFGITFLYCDIDARTGGGYKLVFSHPSAPEPMTFFGRYLDVIPGEKLVWTNEEGDEEGAITTVTFEDRGSSTIVVMHDLYPSKEALDEAISSGSTSGFDESFDQLEDVLTSS